MTVKKRIIAANNLNNMTKHLATELSWFH